MPILIQATPDSAGGVQSEVTYEPFGNMEMSSPAPAYRFTGREHDEPLYLYYYRARYYHTDLQRFISEDPIGFGGGGDWNLYAYVANNPIRFNDPSGTEKCSGTDCSLSPFVVAATGSPSMDAPAARLRVTQMSAEAWHQIVIGGHLLGGGILLAVAGGNMGQPVIVVIGGGLAVAGAFSSSS